MEDFTDQSKLFVGGVSWETSEETLTEHFSRYGAVVGCVIARDRLSGNPRGFGFVSFSDPAAVNLALQDSHDILGRTVEVKKAIPRTEQHQSKQQQQQQQQHRNNRTNFRTDNKFRTKKIFVGGLSANLTEDEFKGYFEKFGRITDVVVMHDNVTHRPRGFGFITFDSEDAVENVVLNNFHQLNGKQVEVKRAIPKDGSSSSSSSSNNGYNGRTGNGRGSNYCAYQDSSYPPFSPRYGLFPGYGSITGYGGMPGYAFGPGLYGGSYPSGGYVGVSYGVAPFAPRTPWSPSTMVGIRGNPLPYGNSTTTYPVHLGGGVMDIYPTTNGYSGVVGTDVGGKSEGDVQRTD